MKHCLSAGQEVPGCTVGHPVWRRAFCRQERPLFSSNVRVSPWLWYSSRASPLVMGCSSHSWVWGKSHSSELQTPNRWMQHRDRNQMCGISAEGGSLAVLGLCSLGHLPGHMFGEHKLDNCFDIKFWKQTEVLIHPCCQIKPVCRFFFSCT